MMAWIACALDSHRVLRQSANARRRTLGDVVYPGGACVPDGPRSGHLEL